MNLRSTYPLAVHVLLERGNQVLFLRRTGTGYADGLGSVPAGHVESGECASAAAVRECIEEVGVEVASDDLELVLVQHKRDPLDGDERVDLFFRAVRFVGEPVNCEPGKCSGLRWSAPEAMGDLVGYARHAIERIAGGEVYAEFGWGSPAGKAMAVRVP